MMKDLIYNEQNKGNELIKNNEYLLNFSTEGKLI